MNISCRKLNTNLDAVPVRDEDGTSFRRTSTRDTSCAWSRTASEVAGHAKDEVEKETPPLCSVLQMCGDEVVASIQNQLRDLSGA